MTAATCRAKCRDGSPCGARPVPGGDHCHWHDPHHAEQRKVWRAKGGRSRSNVARARKQLVTEPLTVMELQAYLALAFRNTLVGKMEPGVLNALAHASKVMAELLKVTDFETQLAEMRHEIVDLAERREA